MSFAFTSPVFVGESISYEDGNRTITATIHSDDDTTPPWDREDGHGEVSEWTGRDKLPGELVLCDERGRKRFYDYAAAVKTARAEGWGPPTYRDDVEHGANGLVRVTSQWFVGKDLHTAQSQWTGDINGAYKNNRAAMRASYPSARAYHAAAAYADYERLRKWCDDQWCYVGVVVTVTDEDDAELANESLWGIESDCHDYLTETARELVGQALESIA